MLEKTKILRIITVLKQRLYHLERSSRNMSEDSYNFKKNIDLKIKYEINLNNYIFNLREYHPERYEKYKVDSERMYLIQQRKKWQNTKIQALTY